MFFNYKQFFKKSCQTSFEISTPFFIPILILYESIHCNDQTRTIKPKIINNKIYENLIEFYEVTWNKMITTDRDKDFSNLSEYVTKEECNGFKLIFKNL